MSNLGFRLASSALPSARSSALSAWKSTKQSRGQWGMRRHLHSRKDLPYNVEEGLGNFMSPKTLKIVAEDYQQGLLDRLNAEVAGTAEESRSVAQTVIDTAMDPTKTLAFNYASLALNNSFFLGSLKSPSPSSSDDDVDRSELGAKLRSQMGGVEHFKSTFSSSVTGLAGTGYVWLVTDRTGNLAVVPTFAAGTLLVRSRKGVLGDASRTRILGEDDARTSPPLSTDPSAASNGPIPTSPTSGLSHGSPPLHPSSPARSMHISSVQKQMDLGFRTRSLHDSLSDNQGLYGQTSTNDLKRLGDELVPLFCLSVHEHCWLLDHGIWGQQKWLREFWSVLDWHQVIDRYNKFTLQEQNAFFRR
ncbi:hypothetical protein BJ138DRAFT_1139000 [Hygrophoropsis aurantiaca]|uniref:Uncharacterized protein n=1 Tax=Hygrophoropsis aurantiaca TaxID=72124 RepID=A0ACB8ASZ7_9AGAM|nr:hypothetical protein BJ138DRAFT_1139000 [Hygrophoropsis aurantiaca]